MIRRARAALTVDLPSHMLPIVLRRAFDLQQRQRAILFCALLVTASGCATLPRDTDREPSHAWDRPQETKLGRAFAADVEHYPGMSGFHLLGSGLDAFVARMALADVAEQAY